MNHAGENCPTAKLTKTSVREIRCRAAAGEGIADLAIAFAVTGANIYDVVRRRSWRSVEDMPVTLEPKDKLRLTARNHNSAGAWSISSSIFRGVFWDKARNRWIAKLKVGGQSILGRFHLEAHAAYAYDLEVVRQFREFSLTNFPIPGSSKWIFGELDQVEVTTNAR